LGVLFFIVIAVIVVVAIKGSSGGSYDTIAKNGKPARGILLQVASTGTSVRQTGLRLEARSMTIDVEVPGEAPYEVRGTTTFPAVIRADVLPGATVELRVDRKKRLNVVIIGPAVGVGSAFLPQPSQPALPTAPTPSPPRSP